MFEYHAVITVNTNRPFKHHVDCTDPAEFNRRINNALTYYHARGFTTNTMINRLPIVEKKEIDRIPRIGKGATLCYPSDRYPYVIVTVSKTGKKITLLELSTDARIVPGIKAGEDHISSHYYTESEIADPAIRTDRTLVAYRNKRGDYIARSAVVSIGVARYRRDWMD